jgi:hypothetical protein
MESKNGGRFEKSFQYLSWYYSAGAVLNVFHENERRFRAGECRFKACADIWCINDDLREDCNERARRHWCRLTKLDDTYYPLSIDAVARLYFRIRKRRKEEIEAFDREIRDAIEEDADSPSLFDGIEDE